MNQPTASHPPRHNKPTRALLGPGLVTGAADDDPSGIATYSQAGAQFGYGLLWTVFLTTPFMIAIQLVSAFIGRTTGKGIVANAKMLYSGRALHVLIALLVMANVINIAADIAAMSEAAYLVVGGLRHEHALIFAAVSVLLQIFVPYRRYAPILKWLTLVLFLYVGVVFTVEISWREVAVGTLLPKIQFTSDYWMLLVAVLGTTISPYLFFWQASQEVEEMRRRKKGRPLNTLARGGGGEMKRIVIDTSVGMLFSNTIAFFIMLTTAVTLHAHGVTRIETAADAANALRPIAGELAFLMFALGIVGTGLLAIPVLAGSAAYAVAEFYDWPSSLESKFSHASGFYTILAAATVIGFGLTFTAFDPIRMLIWSAVINGVVAVPIMAMMMLIVSHEVMGRFRANRKLAIAGWGATALMAATVVAMIVSMLV
jgi:NRAMP (natural resistance-associated macrophage protein)-like metal ion transporter